MACVHIAHDCLVGENTTMANVATLGGHVELGEWVNLGGGVMVHQFGKIGSHAFVGGGYRVVQDVPPFIIAAGEPLRFGGINKIGLQRRGFSDEKRALIKKAYRTYFVSKINRTDALNKIKSELPATDEIKEIVKQGYKDKAIEKHESELVHGALNFDDIVIRSVMTPRTKMFKLNSKMMLFEALPEINKSGFSRIPVFADNTDQIVGIVHVRDVLKKLESDEKVI